MSKVPFPFVLDEIQELSPYTKPMFGCLAIYVDEKIVFILRKRETNPEDNGVWLATKPEHHDSLIKILPSMRSLILFGPGPTGWQNIPLESLSFEEEVIRACELVKNCSPLIGKIPKRKNTAKKVRGKAPKAKNKKTLRKKL